MVSSFLNNHYFPLFKTGQAEIRAMENTIVAEDQEYLIPIIEITRGRISKNNDEGKPDNIITKISKVFKNYKIIFDITSDEGLSNKYINALYSPENGYEKWINFLDIQKEQFHKIYPTLLLNLSDNEFETNLKKQAVTMLNSFEKIVYKASIADDINLIIDDLKIFSDLIDKNSFIFILDCGYLLPGSYNGYQSVIQILVERVRNLINECPIVCVSTSFPKTVSEIGHDEADDFPLNEFNLYNNIRHLDIHYGDYATVNPVRNDSIARGWIPRIDVPTESIIYYKRQRKGNSEYRKAYTSCAIKAISDKRFPNGLECWGTKAIIEAANGYPAGSSPSFWISVRMNIHITNILNAIKSKIELHSDNRVV